MNRFKAHNPIRDLIFALLLALMVRPALHLSAKRMREEGLDKGLGQLSSHEPDRRIVYAFDTAKDQLNRVIKLAKIKKNQPLATKLDGLLKELLRAEKRYTKNSPALLFLGPFASVSIVLKELELETKLSSIIDEIGKSLQELCPEKNFDYTKDNSLTAGLATNQRMLNRLFA